MARKHNLHFVIDIGMKRQLQRLMQHSGVHSLSRMVRGLLSQQRCSLERFYFQAEEQQSQYGLIDRDLSLARCSLHIYLDEADYRWLKLIHQDLNFYSLAGIVRWVINKALMLWEQEGVALQQQRLRIAESWENVKQEIRRRIEKVVQLLPFCKLNPADVCWISIYNRGFSPMREIFTQTKD